MKYRFYSAVFALSALVLLLGNLALAEGNQPSTDPNAVVTAELATPAPETEAAPQAQPAKPAAKPAAPKAEAKKPQSRLEFTFEERVRSEAWDNIMDYNNLVDDNRRNERFRTKIGMRAGLTKTTDFFLKFGNEWRNYRTVRSGGNFVKIPLDYDETFFDNLYFDFKKTPIQGLSLKIGRMEFTKGEGFLFSDPSAVDGSRSSYYNMFDFTYAFHKDKSKLELIGIMNPRTDRFLPRMATTTSNNFVTVNPNNGRAAWTYRQRGLNEYDEQALGLYYTDTAIKNTTVEAYYFFMKQLHDARSAAAVNFLPDRHFSTVGTRWVRKLGKTYSFGAEFASEFGSQRAARNGVNMANVVRPAADIRAWGGYGWAQKTWNHPVKPYVKFMYSALSGDDPNTKGTYEGFDPMFARSVKYSEVQYYSGSPERGLGYWQNMHGPTLEAGLTPIKRVALTAAYRHLMAFHRYPGSAAIFGNGGKRGEDLSVRAEVSMPMGFKSHLYYESIRSGDFYARKSTAWFLRAELMYTYKYSFLNLGQKK